MNRLLTFLLLFLLLFLLVALASAQDVQLEAQVFDIARELRCPVCQAESVADSSSPTSLEMRNIISERLQAGDSRAEIIEYFRTRYGDWILLSPPKRGVHLFVWVVPILAGLLLVTGLVYYLRRWTRNAAQPIQADEAELERVRLELNRGSEA